MFKSAEQNRSADGTPPDAPESDDNISLTSTVEGQHDSDEEFAVEDILATQDTEKGLYYLVEWSGFPLHESSWEPEGHIGDEIKAMWEEKKRKHESGELKPFDVARYEAALEKAAEEKKQRHQRRNKKRAKLGLPLTPPFPKTSKSKRLEGGSSDDEAFEDPVEVTPEPSTSRARPKPKDVESLPKISTSSTQTAWVKSPSGVPRNQNPPRATGGSRSVSLDNGILPTQGAIASSSRQSSTGYEGTARKLSNKPSTKTSVSGPASKPTSTVQATNAGKSSTQTSARPTISTGKAKLKAKKSTSTHKPTGNIFTGGKIRKARPNLKDAMVDPSKQPKLFPNHRVKRLAELSARSKDDRPPDPSSLALFSPSQANRKSSASALGTKEISPMSPATQQLANQMTDLQMTAEPAPISTARSVSEPKPAVKSQSSLGGSSTKKRKSVRFLSPDPGEESMFVAEPEPMDVDMPGNENSSGHVRLRSPPPASQIQHPPGAPPLKKVSYSDYRSKVTQTVEKKIVLGKDTSVEVLFNGLPREQDADWFTDFMSEKTINFRHACLAQDMEGQVQTANFIQARFVVGTINPRDNESGLEEVAGFLRSGLLGLYCARPNYNILVYPTKCEEWKIDLLGQEPASPSDPPLRYLVFSTPLDCASFLRPLSLSIPPEQADGASKSLSGREALMKHVFEFDYTQLLPAQRQRKPNSPQTFFLAFPQSRGSIMNSLCRWLRECDPNCQLFTSHDAGSWIAFRAAVGQAAGVIIIHEFLIWGVRRFPGLSKHLLGKLDEYWCLGDAIQPLPMFPSIVPAEGPLPPGTMQLNRLFPHRTAILLTPSFLVSEPQRAMEFLDWYLQNHIKDLNYRLVTAWNVHHYLLDLANEKSRARQDLMSQSSMDSVQKEIGANLRGLSHTDCNARYVSATVAFELYGRRVAKAGPFDAEEDSSPLVFADPSIDPNDEQSIVNWFGWWSILRADQFRKFHVVGSSETIKFIGCQRGERRLRVPRYSQVTVNDPDIVLSEVQRLKDESARAEKATIVNKSNPQLVSNRENKDQVNLANPWLFQSELARADNAREIAKVLDEEVMGQWGGSKGRKPPLWTFYKFPVAWADFDMADYFEDPYTDFKRINDWFDFSWPFGSPSAFNTYVGFFYTPTADWDPTNPPANKKGPRHPWVVVYRPVDPHLKPYKTCEVIIWDPNAKAKFPGAKRIAESSLLDMQRRVIEHIRENGHKKNPGTTFERAWLGGFDIHEMDQTASPFDTTVFYLRRLLWDIKNYLPAPVIQMQRMGFRPIVRELNVPESEAANNHEYGSESMDLAGSGNDEDEDGEARIIFHPPRGTNLPPGQRTKCANMLYEEARLARAHGADGDITYQFPPTLEWYNEQRVEGRGFEHISVDSWETVFNHYRIGVGQTGSSTPASNS